MLGVLQAGWRMKRNARRLWWTYCNAAGTHSIIFFYHLRPSTSTVLRYNWTHSCKVAITYLNLEHLLDCIFNFADIPLDLQGLSCWWDGGRRACVKLGHLLVHDICLPSRRNVCKLCSHTHTHTHAHTHTHTHTWCSNVLTPAKSPSQLLRWRGKEGGEELRHLRVHNTKTANWVCERISKKHNLAKSIMQSIKLGIFRERLLVYFE